MKILMVTPSYKSRSRPLMKTRSLERTPPRKKIGFAPLIGSMVRVSEDLGLLKESRLGILKDQGIARVTERVRVI